MEEQMGDLCSSPKSAGQQQEANNSGNKYEQNHQIVNDLKENDVPNNTIQNNKELDNDKIQTKQLHSQIGKNNISGDNIQKIFLKARLHLSGDSNGINPVQTYKAVKKILMTGQNNLSSEKEKTVLELADFWDEFDIEDLYSNDDVVGEQLLKYYQIWMLSARVIVKVKHLFHKIRWNKEFTHQAYAGMQYISRYLNKHELQFYLSKNLFIKQAARFSMDSYSVSSFAKEPNSAQQSLDFIQNVYWIAKENKIEIISALFEFLAKIGIIELKDIKPLFINSLVESLERIHKRQQKEMFISDYSCKHLKDLQDAFQKGDKDELSRRLQGHLPNYSFYKGQIKVRNKSTNIQSLHAKFGDYQFMERVHDYIQWMFPNHYGSAFNSTSKPLNYIESELFIQDRQVKLSLLYSIYMFFDFMGLRLELRSRRLQIVSQERLEDVILVNFHNHLRLMRILACLSVTGFRSIALDLISFLDKHSKKGELLEKQRSQFQRSWKIYGHQQESAKNMCFLEKEDFPNEDKFIHKFLQIAFSQKTQQKPLPQKSDEPKSEDKSLVPAAETKIEENEAKKSQQKPLPQKSDEPKSEDKSLVPAAETKIEENEAKKSQQKPLPQKSDEPKSEDKSLVPAAETKIEENEAE